MAIRRGRPEQPPNTHRERRMAELKADILVLAAGMVGVGAALHLQQRG
jgi:glycerol-3-phosphate dehydrogenase